MRIDQFTLTQNITPFGSLDVETMLLVEADRSSIVDVHIEFQAAETEPTVRQVNQCSKDGTAKALPDVVIVNK